MVKTLLCTTLPRHGVKQKNYIPMYLQAMDKSQYNKK